MTNYMGKRRLQNILMQMLCDRPEMQKKVKENRDFMQYKTYRGSEWLMIWLGDCRFKIYADGAHGKTVCFEEYRCDAEDAYYDENMSQYNRIVTKYNENFEPLPLATWFSGSCELRKYGYFPFSVPEPDDPYYNFGEVVGLEPDQFVCYDITKNVTTRRDI